ncbi:MAG: hydrogenase maturation nickel metallochaperone HypA [Acidobacteriota bacterium]
MHETALAAEILKIARASAAANGGGRLTTVSIVVGELSAVEPSLIAFAWEAVTSGTVDAGSTLEVEFRPARQTCRVCGDVPERAPGSWLRLCPRCQEPLRVEGGDELDVARVTFEEMDA